jgi:DNA polymerase-3 subunit epsilon
MTQNRRVLADIASVALDTDPTSRYSIGHRLVDRGAVRCRLDGRELATFQTLINPQVLIPPDVQQVHGITNRLVQGQPTIEHVLPLFIEFLGESDTILLAHNAPFDLGFLAMALTRLGMTFPPHKLFDTLEMTRRLYPTWPSHRLEHVATMPNGPHVMETRG